MSIFLNVILPNLPKGTAFITFRSSVSMRLLRVVPLAGRGRGIIVHVPEGPELQSVVDGGRGGPRGPAHLEGGIGANLVHICN